MGFGSGGLRFSVICLRRGACGALLVSDLLWRREAHLVQRRESLFLRGMDFLAGRRAAES